MAWDAPPKVPGDTLLSADWNTMVTDQKGHKSRHENTGSDEISVAGLSGLLADAQTPLEHGNEAHNPDFLSTYTRAATIIVAASNSKDTTNADYFCDGVADEVQINQAITDLPAGGGLVLLMDGTFTLAASIVVTKDNVSIVGMGRNTVLRLNAGDEIITSSGDKYNLLVAHVYFWGRTAGGNSGIYLDFYDSLIHSCWFYQCRYAIYSEEDNNSIVNCHFYNNTYGVGGGGGRYNTITGCFFRGGTGVTFGSNRYNVISSCSFRECNWGIYLSTDEGNNIVVGCSFYYCAISAIQLEGSYNSAVGNTIWGYGDGISCSGDRCTISGNNIRYVNNGVSLSSATECTVTGNSIGECLYHGIKLSSSNNNTITGNSVWACDRNNVATYDGIYLTSSDYNIVSSNRCNENDRYEINVSDAASDDNLVHGNHCRGVDHVGAINDVGTGTTLADNVIA